jgi:hypothetical protein
MNPEELSMSYLGEDGWGWFSLLPFRGGGGEVGFDFPPATRMGGRERLKEFL